MLLFIQTYKETLSATTSENIHGILAWLLHWLLFLRHDYDNSNDNDNNNEDDENGAGVGDDDKDELVRV